MDDRARRTASLIRGEEPNFRAARDLLLGSLRDPDAYKETHGNDTNRDLNRWAALKIVFAGLDPLWAFENLSPTNPGLGSWRWRNREGNKRAPGSQNIPCHENASKLFLSLQRRERAATRTLLGWWKDWGLYMRDTAWMGDELMSREYGGTVAEAVHAVLELYEREGGELEAASPDAAEVRELLDLYLDRWYLEHALRAVPWSKPRLNERNATRTDLQLSVAVAGLRSAPQYELVNIAEPLLALMLDWPLTDPGGASDGWKRAWSRYPADDRLAIPALCRWRPHAETIECARARLENPQQPPAAEHWRRSLLGSGKGTVTGYHTLYSEDGGVLTWLDEDTNHETVPTIVYGIDRQGQVRSVLPLGDGPRPHRKVPHSTVEAVVVEGQLQLTVLQHARGGGGPVRTFQQESLASALQFDGRPFRDLPPGPAFPLPDLQETEAPPPTTPPPTTAPPPPTTPPPTTTPRPPHAETPFVCDLTRLSPEQRLREQELLGIFRGASFPREEVPDGFRYSIPDGPAVLSGIGELIGLERLCCPFLSFRLIAPAGDQVILQITGRPGVKDFLLSTFGGA